MITPQRLDRLAKLRSDDGIVSFHLRLEPRLRYEPRLAVTKLKSARTKLDARVSNDRWLEAVDREFGRILRWLEARGVSTRSVAIFACEPEDLWETIELEVPVPTTLDASETPRLDILTRVVDDYPALVVVLVQRDGATIYVSEQREAFEHETIETQLPGTHKAGGSSQARFERYIEFRVRRHLREVVDRLEMIDKEVPFKRLVLAGTQEVTAELESLLSPPLLDRMAGTLSADFKHDTVEHILDDAHSVAADAERSEESALVTRVRNEAASGGRGVVGVEDTLRALGEGRLQTLVVIDDVELRGLECPDCSYLSAGRRERCPVCGATGTGTDNILEHAIERAYLSGVDIEFVSGDARDELMQREGIGALLRY